jgi:hypothetical protein
MISRDDAMTRYLAVQKTFIDSYNSFYSLPEPVSFSSVKDEEWELLRNYSEWFSWYYFIADGHDKNDKVSGDNDVVGMWLLHDFPIENLCEKIFASLVNNSNHNFTVSDHALLIYVSSLSEEEQSSFSVLPLDILHDIFDPLAQSNYESWL